MNLETELSALIDDTEFLEIDRRLRKFNIFDAIGGQRGELRHSNFLAFLMSPNRPHELGSRPLQLILRAILQKLEPPDRPVPSLQIAVADLDDAIIARELDYIDLRIEIRELNLIVAIENKVGAKAGDGQLRRYRSIIEKKYATWKKLFVFLTPTGAEPDDETYVAFSYSELANLLEGMLGDTQGAFGAEIVLIIRHYVEMLRRHVVEDEVLKSLAVKIYERHANALDFISKCKPQSASLLPIAQALAEQSSEIVEDSRTTTTFRFLPKIWLPVPNLNKCPSDKWTRTGRNVLFEIKSFKSDGEFSDRILLSLILGPSEAQLRKAIFAEVDSRRDVFRNAGKTIGQSWVTIYSRELLNGAAAAGMDETEKRETIETTWKEFESGDLPRLTEEVKEIASRIAG